MSVAHMCQHIRSLMLKFIASGQLRPRLPEDAWKREDILCEPVWKDIGSEPFWRYIGSSPRVPDEIFSLDQTRMWQCLLEEPKADTRREFLFKKDWWVNGDRWRSHGTGEALSLDEALVQHSCTRMAAFARGTFRRPHPNTPRTGSATLNSLFRLNGMHKFDWGFRRGTITLLTTNPGLEEFFHPILCSLKQHYSVAEVRSSEAWPPNVKIEDMDICWVWDFPNFAFFQTVRSSPNTSFIVCAPISEYSLPLNLAAFMSLWIDASPALPDGVTVQFKKNLWGNIDRSIWVPDLDDAD